MITSVRVALARPEAGAAPILTFLLFSTALAEDANLLELYVPVDSVEVHDEAIGITWSLPDPAIRLGQVDISRSDAAEYRARNQVSGGIHMLLLPETSGASDRRSIDLKPYYVDWLGAAGDDQEGSDPAQAVPVSTWGRHRARLYLRQGRPAQAVQALLDEVGLATRADGSFTRHAAYTLHEVAVLAEAVGMMDAWEYFEAVALMIYPNCHDALIGLALCAKNDPGQALPLLTRAYAIRPQAEDLRLFARSLARPSRQKPSAVRDAILTHTAEVDLAVPLFRDPSGRPLSVAPEEVLAHLQALADRIAGR
jgi:hypothetical protein